MKKIKIDKTSTDKAVFITIDGTSDIGKSLIIIAEKINEIIDFLTKQDDLH